ncbi:MAG: hypothetical protein JOY60_10980, partial [Burkholderiaceae bacterium]|nr:hypothetical protein [Burkholderiaceae bacterium]
MIVPCRDRGLAAARAALVLTFALLSGCASVSQLSSQISQAIASSGNNGTRAAAPVAPSASGVPPGTPQPG